MSPPAPARAPAANLLEGRHVRLEPLAPEHAADLFSAAGPERYAYLPEHPPADTKAVERWIEGALGRADPLFWAVVDTATGRCEGRQALMSIVPEHGVIELGNIMWGGRMARSRLATEAFFLHACHVFDDLGYRRFEWKCNALNEPSRAAARRFGFTYEGTFRQHRIAKGENRDTAWFSIIDSEWPAYRAAFERWLAPGNFDADGTQRTRLALR